MFKNIRKQSINQVIQSLESLITILVKKRDNMVVELSFDINHDSTHCQAIKINDWLLENGITYTFSALSSIINTTTYESICVEGRWEFETIEDKTMFLLKYSEYVKNED